jgi:hypothetical protein
MPPGIDRGKATTTMIDLSFDVSLPPSAPRGRKIKFTPERMNQIRNLVERGCSREEIAATIGVTVGSLQVTCSRAGISLRRLKTAPVVAALPRPPVPYTPGPTRDPASVLEAPVVPSNARPPSALRSPSFALRIQHGGTHRDIPLSLSLDAIGKLAIAAEAKGLRMAELIASLVTAAVKQGVP